MGIICIDEEIKSLRTCEFDVEGLNFSKCPPGMKGEGVECLSCEHATLTEVGLRYRMEMDNKIAEKLATHSLGRTGGSVTSAYLTARMPKKMIDEFRKRFRQIYK